MTSDQHPHHQHQHQHEEAVGIHRKPTNFSIEHILNGAGSSNSNPTITTSSFGLFPSDYSHHQNVLGWREESPQSVDCQHPEMPFTWLQCTRYCPPKVPRKREGVQKRQLGRHPRIPFTSHQLAVLEEKYKQSAYLSSEEVTKISTHLDLADIRVKIWFQNRRARERRDKLSLEVSGSGPAS